MRNQVKRAREQAHDVERFNQKWPVGTKVRYWTGLREGPGKEGKTSTDAELLGGHTAVVWIEGASGCVALTHVEVLR